MQRSEQINELATALSKFQQEVKQPGKDAANPFFNSKYVPLELVVDAINNTAPLHGLSFTQWSVISESGRVGVSTMIIHSSGQWMEYDPLFMKPDKDTPQAVGSAMTYARRYSLSAAFGIASEVDDDGNAASGDPNKPSQPRQQQTQSNTPAPPSQPSNVTLASPNQAKMLYAKSKAGEVSMQRISDFLGYEVKECAQVHAKDVNKLIKMLDDAKQALDDAAGIN